ncbi:MAG: hypothetical protein QW051_01175 [Candidatus Aenigmatarchaeota archaeon]
MFDFKISLKKAIRNLVIALISIFAAGLMSEFPALAQYQLFGGLTVYTLLLLLRDWLKHRWGLNV